MLKLLFSIFGIRLPSSELYLKSVSGKTEKNKNTFKNKSGSGILSHKILIVSCGYKFWP